MDFDDSIPEAPTAFHLPDEAPLLASPQPTQIVDETAAEEDARPLKDLLNIKVHGYHNTIRNAADFERLDAEYRSLRDHDVDVRIPGWALTAKGQRATVKQLIKTMLCMDWIDADLGEETEAQLKAYLDNAIDAAHDGNDEPEAFVTEKPTGRAYGAKVIIGKTPFELERMAWIILLAMNEAHLGHTGRLPSKIELEVVQFASYRSRLRGTLRALLLAKDPVKALFENDMLTRLAANPAAVVNAAHRNRNNNKARAARTASFRGAEDGDQLDLPTKRLKTTAHSSSSDATEWSEE